MTGHTAPSTGSTPAAPWSRRPAVLGFVVGFVATFVVTVLALVTDVAEVVHPFLVPAAPLLAPVAGRLADWNGLVAMVLRRGRGG